MTEAKTRGKENKSIMDSTLLEARAPFYTSKMTSFPFLGLMFSDVPCPWLG